MVTQIKDAESFDQLVQSLEALIGGMTTYEQLKFWQSFRRIHRARIANTEAELSPELMTALDAHINRLLKEVYNGQETFPRQHQVPGAGVRGA